MAEDTRKSIGLSLGTSGVSIAVLHQHDSETPEILAFHRVPARYLRSGMIVNLEALQDAISDCRRNISSLIRSPLRSAAVNLCGVELRTVEGISAMEFKRPTEIRRKHLPEVHVATRLTDDPAWRLVHIFPACYQVDDQSHLTSPIGMLGKNFSVELQQVSVSTLALNNLLHAISRCGFRVTHLVADPLGAFEALVTNEEREMGLWILDIGGSVIQLAYVKGRSITLPPSLPIGGDSVTSDIALGLNTTIRDAEQIKIEYGRALPELASNDRMVHIPPVGGGRSENPTSQHRLAEIIKSRMEEMLELVAEVVNGRPEARNLAGNLVLTGGGVLLPGTIELASKYLGMPVFEGHLRNVSGLTDIAPVSLCASAVGLALYGLRKEKEFDWEIPGQSRYRHFVRKMVTWFGGEA